MWLHYIALVPFLCTFVGWQTRIPVQLIRFHLLLFLFGTNFGCPTRNDSIFFQHVQLLLQSRHNMCKRRSKTPIRRPTRLLQLNPRRWPTGIGFRPMPLANDAIRVHARRVFGIGRGQGANLPKQNSKGIRIHGVIVG